MNEADTRAELIDPLLVAACWGVVEGSRIRREFPIAPGRLEGGGKRGKALSADDVLSHRNTGLAVVEAKADSRPLTESVGQAKEYAAKLQLRFAYASNGKGLYAIDMDSGEEGETEAFPTPQDLWRRTFAVEKAWRDRLAAIPCLDKGGSWQIRFYQDIAVKRVLEAIASGQNRILLTLATGTGKTSIAFLIIWMLFAARWNLSGQPSRRPRILYTPDDTVLEGEIEAGKLYKEADFNKILEIKRREQQRVEIFMGQIDQREKTLVFCATQDHALAPDPPPKSCWHTHVCQLHACLGPSFRQLNGCLLQPCKSQNVPCTLNK
jgi:type I site-specific restriction endonuclease